MDKEKVKEMSSPVLEEQILIDFRMTIPEAEDLADRLKSLRCGDPSELYRQEIGKIDGKVVIFAVGLKQ